MFNRFSRKLIVLWVFNISFLLIDLHSQNAISRNAISNEYISSQEKESLDLNKINSSVDAGSFYSVDVSIKQLEENMARMAQELNRLKQHVEFAKMSEQKRILQIQKLEKEVQKLEKENVNLRQPWLNNSFDNSWTGSSSKMESMESSDNKSHDVELTTTEVVKQAEPVQIPTVTLPESTQIAIAIRPVPTQPEPTKTATVEQQTGMTKSQPVHQDVIVQVVE